MLAPTDSDNAEEFTNKQSKVISMSSFLKKKTESANDCGKLTHVWKGALQIRVKKEINSCLYIIRKKKFNRLVQKETEKAKRVEKEEERRNKSDSI
jgi:hypothetical protein